MPNPTNEVDALLSEMLCPVCGEYSRTVSDLSWFYPRACGACDLEVEQEHIERGCAVSGCPCQDTPRHPANKDWPNWSEGD